MTLRLPRHELDARGPGVDVGDEALVRLAVVGAVHPHTGAATADTQSGVQALLRTLRERYGLDVQDTQTIALEGFFTYARRGRLPLQEFISDFMSKYEEAETQAGLTINNVGLSYLLLKQSELPEKVVDDIKLQLHGDLGRFLELKTLLLRLARANDKEKEAAFRPEPSHHFADGESDDSDWHGDCWHENEWTDDMWENDWQDDQWQQPTMDRSYSSQEDPQEALWKGKGKGDGYKGSKGKGKDGCATCGSKYHR